MSQSVGYLRLSVMVHSFLISAVGGMALCTLTGCGGGSADRPTPAGPSAPVVTGVTITPSDVTRTGVGASATLQATLRPSNATGSVSWRTDNATIATVSGTGGSATVQSIAGGTVSVFATVGSVEGRATVTVIPIARQLTVLPAALAVDVGGSRPLTATLVADIGAATTLTWASSAQSIAIVSASGVVTGVAPGTTTITVSSVATPTVQATASVTVSAVVPVVRSVTLTPVTASILVAGSRQLTATVDAEAGANTSLTWGSSASAVATVNGAGLVTAHAPGTATITATSVANSSAKASSTITVVAPTVQSLSVTPTSATLYASASRQLIAQIVADPGASTAVAWTSSVPSVATVGATGVVTALALGSTTITVRSALVPTVSASAAITVSTPPPLTQWTPSSLAADGGASYPGIVYDLWATPTGTTFAVMLDFFGGAPNTGNTGPVGVRLNGRWQPRITVSFGYPVAVGGFGEEVWVGTGSGTIGRWNGTQFEQMSTPTGLGTVHHIVGLGPGSAAAALRRANGLGTKVLLLQNGVWTALPDPPIDNAGGLAGSSPTTLIVYSVGAQSAGLDAVVRWDGTAWRRVSALYGAHRAVLVENDELLRPWSSQASMIRFVRTTTTGDVFENGPAQLTPSEGVNRVVKCAGNVYASTQEGGRVFRRDPGGWTVIGNANAFVGVASRVRVHCGADGVVRASATNVMARWTGSSWILESSATVMHDVSVVSPTRAFALSGPGTIVEWNGSNWSTSLAVNTPLLFREVSATTDGTVYAANNESPARVYRLSGGQWFTEPVPFSQLHLWGWSSTFALGASNSNTWSRWNGSTWQNVSAPGTVPYVLAMAGSGPDFAVAVGAHTFNLVQSYIVHWDGSSWQVKAVPNVGLVNAVSVVTPSLAFAMATTAVLRWDGSSWATMPHPPSVTNWLAVGVVSISAVSAIEVYATFGSPEIWLYDGTTWRVVGTTAPSEFWTFASISVVPGFGIATGYDGVMSIGTPPGGVAAALQRFMRDRRR